MRITRRMGGVVGVLDRLHWDVAVEATYSRFGERGSIDILALHRESLSGLVVEVKTQLVSVEELARHLDQKLRLAPLIANERFGLRPRHVSKLVVLPNRPTERRRVARHDAVMSRIAPCQDAREIRHWLREPSSPMSGLWFVSSSHLGTARNVRGGPCRVLRPATADVASRDQHHQGPNPRTNPRDGRTDDP